MPKNIDGGNKKQVLDRWHEVRNCRPLQLAGKLSQKRRGEYGGFWRGVSRSGEYPVVRCMKQQTVEHATVPHFLEEVEVVVAMTEQAQIEGVQRDESAIQVARTPRHVCSARGSVSENNNSTTTHSRPRQHFTTSGRGGVLLSPSSCLDGASYGWVPVDTHSTPVLTTVKRLWQALPQNDTTSTAQTCDEPRTKLSQHDSGALGLQAWLQTCGVLMAGRLKRQ